MESQEKKPNQAVLDSLKDELTKITELLKEKTESKHLRTTPQEVFDTDQLIRVSKEVSEAISRSKNNRKRILELKESFLSHLQQIRESLTSLEDKKATIREELMSFKSKVKTRFDTLFQHIKTLITKMNKSEHTTQQLQQELEKQKETVHQLEKTFARRDELRTRDEDLQALKKHIREFSDHFIKREELQEYKEFLKELKESIAQLSQKLEGRITFLLNFPKGITTLQISREKDVGELLDAIKVRIKNTKDVPPSIQRKVKFDHLRGLDIRHKGERLEPNSTKTIDTLVQGALLPTVQIRPYWKLEDLGGEVRVNIEYSNGDRAIFMVPSNMPIAVIQQEIQERILNAGEGLKPDAKKRWRTHLKEGEIENIEDFEIIGNGQRINDLSRTVSEIQLKDTEEVNFMVSFAYL
ncbi:MAG: hypothetical protein GWO20_13265 [Candidatus Korarchaeota archaeon]|nr:hypothetical protein [Candidatus Korarchaeota archaeon]NIU84364.1 hypothetical protein [Candidatus Thorarchaeota archaeon]NIW14480.1 hypothetical protein [Candidatus Thorarchaeota archaeon]NIW52557.1 hypothetical protein [Candidatus Korarchaeota archaeon]